MQIHKNQLRTLQMTNTLTLHHILGEGVQIPIDNTSEGKKNVHIPAIFIHIYRIILKVCKIWQHTSPTINGRPNQHCSPKSRNNWGKYIQMLQFECPFPLQYLHFIWYIFLKNSLLLQEIIVVLLSCVGWKLCSSVT